MLYIDFVNWRRQDPFAGMKRDANGELRDNFSCLLFHLIQKADFQNRDRLSAAFPLHYALWAWWTSCPEQPTEKEIEKKAEQIERIAKGLDEEEARTGRGGKTWMS